MKKSLCLILAGMLLLTGCGKESSGGSDKPSPQYSYKAELLKACDAYDKLKSFTWETYLDLTAYRESGEYPMYLYLSLVIDYGDLNDSKDDMLYEYSDTNGEVMFTWQKDNILYINDNHTRYQQSTVNEDMDYGYGKMLRKIVNSAEEITAEQSGTDTVYAITVNDKILDAYLDLFPAKRNSLTESQTGKKTYFTIDKDGYFKDCKMDIYMTWEGIDYMCLFDMTLEDINNSVIPEFDPEVFDGSEVEYDVNKIIMLDFEDLPVVVWLEFDKESEYTLQLYPEDSEFDVLNNDYNDVYCTGKILYKKTSDRLIDEIRQYSAEYKIYEERKLPLATAVIGFCETFVKSIEGDTNFVVVTFDDLDIGFFIKGYGEIDSLIRVFNELKMFTVER